MKNAAPPPCLRISVVLCIILCIALAGCPAVNSQLTSLPDRYEVENKNLIVRSDLKIKADNPLLHELTGIRDELVELLDLPTPSRPVVIHLFGDEQRYTSYMRERHPNLPPRRAFFIGSPTELGVYAHWSDKVGEDLRHEYTHGVLHSCLKSVPLWLDEGLAEYFETPEGTTRRLHREHTERLAIALGNGWRPDFARLEQIEDVSLMGRADYQEAWAWVHYLIHEAPDGRELLVDYCQNLRKTTKPPRLAEKLKTHYPDAELRLTGYISGTLVGETPLRWVRGQDQDGKSPAIP